MSDFDMHSFCRCCGRHRHRMPFGSASYFFDANRGPCRHCGEPGPGHQIIARPVGLIRRRWVNRSGEVLNLEQPK